MGEMVQGENKGRKGKGRGSYVWNRGLPTSTHYLIIPLQTRLQDSRVQDGQAEPLLPVVPAEGERLANETEDN